ncbi:MAG: S-adenosyl-l-methionine hydroxide adenosyltransferase family protein [Sphaerochaetaceae bacterium]|nr:S-adenosyl-l-methionine hydroxide adenosyltransferase family protein [Sphaerochaetaceae bacterium]
MQKLELLKEKPWQKRNCVVFLSDFGSVDAAVSAMYAVADGVSPSLRLYDLTHEIPQFDIWAASYRLMQAMSYWAVGTVFVCVVDPGVGSERKSIVALTKSGHLIVTPDNGTLTHIAEKVGILEVREISETTNRLKGSQKSYTFHGRDVYAYTGARLASGLEDFENVGPLFNKDFIKLKIERPRVEGKSIIGAIDILDTRYGSLWTNIPESFLEELKIEYGQYLNVTISINNRITYGYKVKYCQSFSQVDSGEPVLYVNSLLTIGLAVNKGNFSKKYRIGTGEGWKISLNLI